MKTLITGGAGFIGSFLAERLIKSGNEVVIVDNLSSGQIENLSGLKYKFFKCDINDDKFLRIIDDDTDTIYHLAANAYVPISITNPMLDFHTNATGTLKLLEHIRKSELNAKFIYASSAAVYGEPLTNPIKEDARTLPMSPYGASKLAAESYCNIYANIYGLKTVSLRFFSSFGPRLKKQVIYDFMYKLRNNNKILRISGDGKQVRDFNYIENHIDAALLIKKFDGSVYNIASGRTTTILDVAKIISSEMGLSPKYEFDNERKGDPISWIPNIDKIKSLGYKPKISLEEGIKKTVEWFNEY